MSWAVPTFAADRRNGGSQAKCGVSDASQGGDDKMPTGGPRRDAGSWILDEVGVLTAWVLLAGLA